MCRNYVFTWMSFKYIHKYTNKIHYTAQKRVGHFPYRHLESLISSFPVRKVFFHLRGIKNENKCINAFMFILKNIKSKFK
jgi:hypothetical protein